MSDFDLEREVAAMLGDHAEVMPAAVEGDPTVVGRARARRRTKVAALGGGSAAAMALVVGLAVVANRDDKDAIRIQPADTTSEPDPEITTSVAPEPSTTVASEPTSTTTAPVAGALQPGAIVAAHPDGVIVELDAAGNELRELYNADGNVVEIDVAPSGDALYVRVGDYGSCGEVRGVDLETGANEAVGDASGFAISGDGKVVALTHANACGSASQSVVVRHLVTGNEFEFPFEEVDALGNPSPDYPGAVALNFNGSRIAFERCWEGCNVLLADVPVQCLDNSVECDAVAPPNWNDMTRLEFQGSGYGAGAYDPAFQGGTLLARDCDCDVDAGSSNERLAQFDPVTGARIGTVRELPDGPIDFAAEGAVLLLLVNDAITAYDGDQQTSFPGTYTAVALVPVAEE